MDDTTFIKECEVLNEIVDEAMNDKRLTVCIAVLTKLVGELIHELQDDPTDAKEGMELIDRAKESIVMSYTMTQAASDDTPLH